MKTIPLNYIFDIEYGSQLDFSKMTFNADENGINFISRSSKNFGIVGKVLKDSRYTEYQPGLITVTLGGSYLLASFIQPESFYTAQNIKVLSCKEEMTFNEKLYYCLCIQNNRFSYSSHGREANVSLDTLLVPDREDIPKWVFDIKGYTINANSVINKSLSLSKEQWKYFKIIDLFEIEKGREQISKSIEGNIPLISASNINNGIVDYIDNGIKKFPPNCITITKNGCVGESFYQSNYFYATSDVLILKPKFEMNKYIGLFISLIIKREKYRYNYGRKLSDERVKELHIKLPQLNNSPDYQFMENYIKSLPFSASI